MSTAIETNKINWIRKRKSKSYTNYFKLLFYLSLSPSTQKIWTQYHNSRLKGQFFFFFFLLVLSFVKCYIKLQTKQKNLTKVSNRMMKVMLRMPNAKWRGKGILEAQAPTEPHKSPWASTQPIECSIQNPTNVVTPTHPFIQLHALDTDHTLSRIFG